MATQEQIQSNIVKLRRQGADEATVQRYVQSQGTQTGGQAPNMSTLQGPVFAPPPDLSQTQQQQPEEQRNVFGKVANFLAPTATQSFEKLQEGEKLTGRDILGSALEIGSFLVPVGGIARGLGLAGKGALTLGRKAGLGAAVGASSGTLAEAGRAIGEGEDIAGIIGQSLKGAAFGGTIGAAFPFAARGASKVGRRTAESVSRPFTRKAEQRALLEAGETDARIASKKLLERQGRDPKIIRDRVAQEAIKQGAERGDVALIKGFSQTDAKKAKEMLNLAKRAFTNKRIVDRTTDIVGDTFLEQAKFLARVNKNAGNKLDQVAQRLRGQKVDIADPIGEFIQQLDSAAVRVKGNKLDFKGSDFEGIGSAERALQNVWNRLQRFKGGQADALEAHRLKKFIDNSVSYGKTSEGLVGQAERLLKGVRHGVDSVLDTKFPIYNKVNQEFAETIAQLSNISKQMGRNFRIGDDFANMRAGTTLRRILSNTQSRSNLMALVGDMQQTARKYGMKIDDDIINQVSFADTIENIFGSEAPTSLMGQFEKAAGRVEEAAGVAKSIGQGNFIGAGFRAGKSVLEHARGISQENKIKAIESLLDDVIKGGGRVSNFGTKGPQLPK